jgi:hypothetical protein
LPMETQDKVVLLVKKTWVWLRIWGFQWKERNFKPSNWNPAQTLQYGLKAL